MVLCGLLQELYLFGDLMKVDVLHWLDIYFLKEVQKILYSNICRGRRVVSEGTRFM